ncbi:MAG: N-acetyltransferase [Marinomonas sp.]
MILPVIRPEIPSDIPAIHALTKAAFAPMWFSNGSEADIIDQLRKDGDLTLSWVAVQDGKLVGHIAFSPVTISDGPSGWFGLGPVSAAPDLQRKGIGSALINAALVELRKSGAKGVVLLGSTDYYPRFGFEHRETLTYGEDPTEFFQVLKLSGDWPSGAVKYAPAFG